MPGWSHFFSSVLLLCLLLIPSASAATITWDGGGDGTTWSNAANWSGDAVPGASDDVNIDVTSSTITVVISSAVTVKSILCEENLIVTSGYLSISGPSTINGSLTVASGGSLYSNGSLASLQANGATSISGANLYASSGGKLLLSHATGEYVLSSGVVRTLEAQGAGSLIDLSGLSVLTGSPGHDEVLTIRCRTGASINLSSVTQIRRKTTLDISGSGSTLDLSGCTKIDGSYIGYSNGNGVYARVFADGQCSVLLPSLTTVVSAGFYASGGAVIDLSSVTTLTCTQYTTSAVRADGQGSKVDLSALPLLSGPYSDDRSFAVVAASGGVLDLSSITDIVNNVGIVSTGLGSLVDLTDAERLDGSGIGYAYSDGSIYLTVSILDGGSVLLPNLTTAVSTGFYAYDGLTLSLPKLASIFTADFTTGWVVASGMNSLIEMPMLTSLVGHPATSSQVVLMKAEAGGRIVVPILDSISGQVTLIATGTSSVLSFPSLTNWGAWSQGGITASNGGLVQLNPVQTNIQSIPVTLSTLGLAVGRIEVGTLNLSSTAKLTGKGTIAGNVVANGNVYPGGSAAFGGLIVDGNFSLASTGKLNVDIGGAVALIQYDQLTATGAMTFDGTLALNWLNGFVPAQSDKFDLAFWGSRSGEFASVTGTVPAAGHTMRTVYRPARLVIGELAGLISPAVPALSTPRNVALTYDLSPHNEFAAQPSWSISPSDTPLYTATIDANSILTITPKTNEHGTAAPILTLTDLSDGFSDVQDLDLTVELILPTPPIPFIFPSGEPLETDNLVCGLYPGTVGPGCPIQYEYTWASAAAPSHTGNPPFVPQTIVNGPKADVVDILDASYTNPHEIWTCTVRTYDGQYYSSTPGVAVSGVIKALAQSTLTLNTSAPSVTLGEYITFSGGISPVVGVAPVLFEESVTPAGGTDTKPPTTNTNSSSTFSFQFLPDEAGSWGFNAEWQGNRTHFGDNAVAAVTVAKAQPTVTLEVSPSSMPLGEDDEVFATARLTSSLPAQLSGLLAGRRIRLFLRMPDGTSAGPVEADTDTAGIATFDHSAFATTGIDFNQPGTWQFIAEFQGDTNLLRATSPGYDTPGAERLTVKDGAGYAIIAVGQLDATAEGLDEHQLTADNVYRALRDRGFADEDIYYLRRGPQQPAADIWVDDTSPSKADLQAALQGWAPSQMNNAAAPLFVILIDHGAPEQFFLFNGVTTNNDHFVTPGELDGYLTTLEGALNTDAHAKPLTVVYGACHSGSFIPALSGPNRIVVTSTSAEEKSHRGPALTEGGVRDGELFVTELFRVLRDGKNFMEAFQTAAQRTEEYTASRSNDGIATIPQRPLLDDNADGAGSTANALYVVSGQDGAFSFEQNLGFGIVNAATPISWIEATRNITLADGEDFAAKVTNPGEPAGTLFARATRAPEGDSAAWLEIKSPEYAGASLADAEFADFQRVVAMPRVADDDASYDAANFIFRWTGLDTAFDAPGTYKVFYYLREGQAVTSYLLTTIYREFPGNRPPSAVSLTSPLVNAVTSRTPVFVWQPSVDPDGDAITYRLEIDTTTGFDSGNTIVIDGITGAFQQVGSEYIADQTTYYWRVIPTDEFGASPANHEMRSFTVDQNNPTLPGTLCGRVRDLRTLSPIANAHVAISPGFLSATTSATGDFVVTSLPPMTYSVQVTASNYDTSSRIATVFAGGISQADFLLSTSVAFLNVSPTSRNVGEFAGTETFDLTRSGMGAMNWTAQIVTGTAWLGIQGANSGLNNGQVTVAFTANLSAQAREGILRITAPGAFGSPADIVVRQQAASNPVTTGSVRVTLTPQGAIDDGAMWRVDGGAWNASGATVSDLSPGTHTVECNTIPFWVAPQPLSITVVAGETTEETGVYISHPPEEAVPLNWVPVFAVVLLAGAWCMNKR